VAWVGRGIDPGHFFEAARMAGHYDFPRTEPPCPGACRHAEPATLTLSWIEKRRPAPEHERSRSPLRMQGGELTAPAYLNTIWQMVVPKRGPPDLLRGGGGWGLAAVLCTGGRAASSLSIRRADSDEVARAFRDDAAHGFRHDVAQGSVPRWLLK